MVNNKILEGKSLSSFNLPIFELVDHFAKKYPDTIAISFEDRNLNYAAFKKKVDRLAVALQNYGIKKGDTIGLLLPNCPQYVISLIAIMKIGAISVNNMSPLFVERELEYQIKDAKTSTIIVLDEQYEKIKNIRDRLNLKNIIIANPYDCMGTEEIKTVTLDPSEKNVYFFHEIINNSNPNNLVIPPVTLDDIAVLQYTGGTTGVFKGAMLTHRNFCSMVQASRAWSFCLEGNERTFVALPVAHIYCLSIGVLTPLANASTIILVLKFKIEELPDLLKKTHPTYFIGVPSFYVAMNQYKKSGFDIDISSIKLFLSGAAPLSPQVWQEFKDLYNTEIREGYGCSECCPVITCNSFNTEKPVKKGSVGIPYYNTKVRIEFEDDSESGEIVVQGPQVMKGYWNNQKETENVLKDNWLYTGDIGAFDEDGYLFIKGRKKDMICVGGYNAFASECDEIFESHPKVLEACAVGLPHAYLGEQVAAFLVLKKGESMTKGEFIEYCQKHLAAYKVPRAVVFKNSLPRDNVKKVMRRILREEYLKENENAPAN